jgi:hypothetical protein
MAFNVAAPAHSETEGAEDLAGCRDEHYQGIQLFDDSGGV